MGSISATSTESVKCDYHTIINGAVLTCHLMACQPYVCIYDWYDYLHA